MKENHQFKAFIVYLILLAAYLGFMINGTYNQFTQRSNPATNFAIEPDGKWQRAPPPDMVCQ